VAHQLFHRLPVEQRRVVVGDDREPAVLRGGRQGERALGGAVAERHGFDLQSGHPDSGVGCRLEGEENVVQRCAGAGGHEPRGGHVAVGERGGRGVAYPVDQLAEGGVAGEVGPQRQGGEQGADDTREVW
jgi:hypothetical protein